MGLRGCPGVDLFYTGQFQYPSEEECAKMTFGLSKNDISLFLQHKELKYAKEREVADFEDSYCSVQPVSKLACIVQDMLIISKSVFCEERVYVF